MLVVEDVVTEVVKLLVAVVPRVWCLGFRSLGFGVWGLWFGV